MEIAVHQLNFITSNLNFNISESKGSRLASDDHAVCMALFLIHI